MAAPAPYLARVYLKEEVREQITVDGSEYPFNLPIVRDLDIEFVSPVTFFVGENGTGKSTVMEAIASVCRLPVSGGGRNELSRDPWSGQDQPARESPEALVPAAAA